MLFAKKIVKNCGKREYNAERKASEDNKLIHRNRQPAFFYLQKADSETKEKTTFGILEPVRLKKLIKKRTLIQNDEYVTEAKVNFYPQ